MSTEYRRGIPSSAHVEAATRLGLLWWAENNDEDYWRFGVVRGEVHSIYDNRLNTVTTGRLSPCFDEERIASFRPIRPDGTPVEWEVLDQEVARMGQQGQTWISQTVIPTDEQGNPVSWEAAGFAVEAARSAQETVQRAANDATPARSVGDIEWTVTGQPVTRDRTVEPATGTVRSTHTARIRQLDRLVTEAIQAGNQAGFSVESSTPPRPGQFSNNLATQPITTLSLPLPRFTTDELDDIDHSKTTKLDEVTLRRGKLPTVEQIAKYREVRARRTGGAVADALKESRIDCEVAQYVLERWAGGLGDEEAHDLIHSTATLRVVVKGVVHIKAVDNRVVSVLSDCYSLDTSEKPSPTVQRDRQEVEERRQRLAELRQRLAAERAAQPQEMAKEGEMSRFDLIEPDPQADPTASIRAWEARQAAAKAHPTAALPRIAKPAAAPRRPAIEVVDAEVDGLSRSEAFAALFGRAFNGGC